LDLAYISNSNRNNVLRIYLLTTSSGITHRGEAPVANEELTPSLENFVVPTWLRLLHPSLPRLVKQRYGTELRCRTLTSVKPEISQALDLLLDELHTSDESKILRSSPTSEHRSFTPTRRRPPPKPRVVRSCPLCQQASRSEFQSHFPSNCRYLPESDRLFMSRIRQVAGLDSDESRYDYTYSPDLADPTTLRSIVSTCRTILQQPCPPWKTLFPAE